MTQRIPNNGFDKHSPEVEKLISVTPSPLQLEFHELGYYSFIHYGMNTFTGREWGTGKEKPKKFNPKKVDTDQWIRVLSESGSKMIIFTAKHHDGFCLFQTAHTEHSIKNSPYQKGKGDIVRQMAQSCKKYGVGLGIYLSPWDRHDERYGTDAYNDYFVNQLTELCTNYGEISCFWFDGAKGKEAPEFEYDFERYYEVIRTLQPKAVISNCGPDVRWIGNEAGKCRESEWNVVPKALFSVSTIQEKSQHEDKQSEIPRDVNAMDSDLGSREAVKGFDELMWYPAEADVSIHRGWFYSKHPKRKKAEDLVDIYFNTVGANASLLMNVPPSKKGVIEERDVRTLKKFRQGIDEWFGEKLDFHSEQESYELTDNENELVFSFGRLETIKTMVISEYLAKSQRVEKFEVYAEKGGECRRVHCGTVIGSKRIIRFDCLKTDRIRLVFTQTRDCPVIRDVEFYK